jgi:hypothetical protein
VRVYQFRHIRAERQCSQAGLRRIEQRRRLPRLKAPRAP